MRMLSQLTAMQVNYDGKGGSWGRAAGAQGGPAAADAGGGGLPARPVQQTIAGSFRRDDLHVLVLQRHCFQCGPDLSQMGVCRACWLQGPLAHTAIIIYRTSE